MPTLSVLQPAYLPWIGFFDKVIQSDVFVYYDTAQYVHNDFLNRNKIKMSDGDRYLTVPVLTTGKLGQSILETKIDNARNWQKKHCLSIEQAYKKAPYYAQFAPDILSIIRRSHTSLSQLNIEVIESILEKANLASHGDRYIASNLVAEGRVRLDGSATENLIELCKAFGCDRYITGMDLSYLDTGLFGDRGIEIVSRQFGGNLEYPTYPQLHGEFVSHLAAINMLLNVGSLDMLTAL